MSIISKRKDELEDINTAKSITGVLRDISAMEIDALKKDFAKNQNFYSEISELYRLVKAKAQKAEDNNGTNVKNKTSANKNKEVVLLSAVTSNRRFFGELNRNVMEKLIQDIQDRIQGHKDVQIECKIIGKTGKEYMQREQYHEKCQYIIFNEENPTLKERWNFLKKIEGYDKVFMFYPKFINVFRQGVEITEISYTPELIGDEAMKQVEYIFEPELFEIMDFFETQVRYLLFDRVLLETELSRTAARLVKMNTAEEKAGELIDKKRQELRKELSSLSSMRLLEIFSGFKQWQKKHNNS